MTDSQEPLHLLLERAEAERDSAAARLARAREAARRLTLQGEQLRAYRDDYRGRDPAREGTAVGMDIVRCHRDFMQRLDQAVQQQQGQQQAAEREAEALRAALVEHETRVAAVRKLIERRHHEERRNAARVEQRRSDDAAQRSAWYVRPAAAFEH
jgi:flagellar protein FliJ